MRENIKGHCRNKKGWKTKFILLDNERFHYHQEVNEMVTKLCIQLRILLWLLGLSQTPTEVNKITPI